MVDARPERIGRYVVLAELGRGAMGMVCKAPDPQLDRIVAIKTVRRAIRILGITGSRNSVPALVAAGADACLTKPVDLQQLQQELDRLRSLLEVGGVPARRGEDR